MYPQYSSTTTGSSLNEWHRWFNDDVPVHCVETFYRNTLYLESVVEKVNQALSRFPQPGRPEIVFSAHSIPMSVIEKGDPYQRQIEETVRLVSERGGWSNSHRLCYQSKVGASRWLQPSLTNTLRQLAGERVREVCIVPIAFVSDHVETLGEIDHEARHLAEQLGFTRFEMSGGLNDSPEFIQALGQIVQDALAQAVPLSVPIRTHGRKLAEPIRDSRRVRLGTSQTSIGGNSWRSWRPTRSIRIRNRPDAGQTHCRCHEIRWHAGGGPEQPPRRVARNRALHRDRSQTPPLCPRIMVTAFLTAWFLAFFRFFLPRTLFRPNSVFKIGYPSNLRWASTPSSSRNTASGLTAHLIAYS
jgi:hypothetical protein